MHLVDTNNVKIWSVTRLPFDPKGWLAEAKAQKSYKKRQIELEEITDDALKELAKKLGSTPENVILDTVLELLESEELI